MVEADATSPPSVTVVAVTYNRRELLHQLLVGLAAQTYPKDRLQVVVIDNGSTDGSSDDLAEWVPRGVEVVSCFPAASVAAARNAGIDRARGDIVAFTDDDCVPDSTWIEALVAAFDDESVGVVQGRTVANGVADPPYTITQQITGLSGLFETCNVAYRRKPLVEHGGNNERLGFFGEDTDIAWRLLDDGWRPRFADDAVIRHAVQPSGLRRQLRHCRRYDNWPALVSAHPRIRGELLFGRWFLNRRTAAYDLAVLGSLAAVATKRWQPLMLSLPYVVIRRPRRGGEQGLRDLTGALVSDSVVCAALVTGSIRERCAVL